MSSPIYDVFSLLPDLSTQVHLSCIDDVFWPKYWRLRVTLISWCLTSVKPLTMASDLLVTFIWCKVVQTLQLNAACISIYPSHNGNTTSNMPICILCHYNSVIWHHVTSSGIILWCTVVRIWGNFLCLLLKLSSLCLFMIFQLLKKPNCKMTLIFEIYNDDLTSMWRIFFQFFSMLQVNIFNKINITTPTIKVIILT